MDDDPDVTRYTGLNPPRAEREATWRGRLEDRTKRPYLCVRNRETGEFIGWAFICPFRDDSGDWELGYRYRKAWWGKGVGSEVGQALMSWGWAQPDIKVIGAVYYSLNAASRAIQLNVGMKDAKERLYFDEGPLPYCEARRD